MASFVDTSITFNHGVEGSSPSALTNEIKHLGQIPRSLKTPCVCTVSAKQLRDQGGHHGLAEFVDCRRGDRCRPLHRGAADVAALLPAR
jgi:hypothetical protein